MLPFVFIFLLCLANTRINTRESNYFTIIVLILFSGLRYQVGYDYDAYLGIMKYPTDWSINRLEPFERFLIKYCVQTKFYQLFFIVNSFITIWCIWGGLNNLKKCGTITNISISILIFLTAPLMFLQSFSIVRHWTALSIVFYGSTWLLRGKMLNFIICIILSTTCHSVGWIGLLYYPLCKFKISLRLNVIAIIICLTCGEVFKGYLLSHITGTDNLLINLFIRYIQSDEGETGLTKIPYVFLAFDIIFLYIRKFKYNDIYQQFSTIYNAGCCLMFLLSFQTTISLRFSTLFLVYIIVAIPYFIVFLKSHCSKTNYTLFFLFLVAFFATMYFYILLIYNTSLSRSQFLPYQLCFYN